MDLHVVVLAAGKGTRMKSAHPKVLHHVGGRPMIEGLLDGPREPGAAPAVVVVGHQADEVKRSLVSRSDLTFVVQEPQLGTADALVTAAPALAGKTGTLVLLSG